MRKQMFAVIFAAVFAVGCSSNDNGTSTSGSSGSNGASGSSGSTSTSGSGGSTSGSGSSGSTSGSGSGSTSGSGGSSGSSGASGPDWTCLGSETPPTPSGSSTAVTLTFVDAAAASTHVTGLTVKLCKAADTTCASPDDTQTDNNGVVSLNAPLSGSAYNGFFDVTGASIPETLIYLPPFASDPNAQIKIITNTDLSFLGLAFGSPDTTSHGLMTGSIEDCTGAAASGVSVDVSDKDSTAGTTTTVFYLSGVAPAQGATATTTDGTFAISNVPPTDNEVVTTTNSDGDVTGSYPVVIKAGAVTTLVAFPNQ